jgi:hypothetical protein
LAVLGAGIDNRYFGNTEISATARAMENVLLKRNAWNWHEKDWKACAEAMERDGNDPVEIRRRLDEIRGWCGEEE